MRLTLLLFFVCVVSCTPIQAKERILNIEEVTSPGGIKAWLVEDKSLPIIALQFSFKGAGAVNNSPAEQGLSRLLSNTMDEGAGDLTSQEFQKQLSDYSISLTFNSGRDNFGGQVETLSRNKEKAFELLTLALTKPRFDAEPLERMRQANITRIRTDMAQPDWISARLFNDIAFAGHPYALNSGGTITSLQGISADDLREFKNNFLTQDRLFISAAGNISVKELANILDRIFGQLPKTGIKNSIEDIELKNTGKIYLYEKDIPQTIIASAVSSFDQKDPDYYALLVMNHIFGGSGFGSRLMEEAREKRGLTYGIYSALSIQDYISYLHISTSTKNNSAKEIMDVVKTEMTSMATTPVENSALVDAKSYITGSMPLSLTSTDNIASILLELQLNERPITYLDNFPDKINAITAEDVKNVAKRILTPVNMITIMVGKPENIEAVKTKEKLPNVE